MTDGSKHSNHSSHKDQPSERDRRRERLAEALRANLKKRKTQSRSRRTGQADARPDGLAASTDGHED
ncbi:MAG: hypothetical protein ACTHNH_20285 [Mesorhizobium sp.]|jgi:hypothetical protein